jgi:hypothetical protein
VHTTWRSSGRRHLQGQAACRHPAGTRPISWGDDEPVKSMVIQWCFPSIFIDIQFSLSPQDFGAAFAPPGRCFRGPVATCGGLCSAGGVFFLNGDL